MLDLTELYLEDLKAEGQDISFDDSTKIRGPFPGVESTSGSRFLINKDKNVWYDFGEDRGGGVPQYLMHVREMPVKAAYEFASEEYYEPSRISQIYNQVHKFYQKNLMANQTVLDYLEKKRHIDKYDARDAGLGWSGTKEESIIFFNKLKKEYDLEELQQVGLLNDAGKPVFTDRITVPFTNLYNDIIYFKGRNITGQNPKYMLLHGCDCPIFGHISGKKDVYVCEGIFDAIHLSILGFNAIALPNAGAREDVLADLLSELSLLDKTKSIIFVEDNDSAGRKLRTRFTRLAERFNVIVKVLQFAAQDDEGEAIKDIEAYILYLDRSKIESAEIIEMLPTRLAIELDLEEMVGVGSERTPEDPEVEAFLKRVIYYPTLTQERLKTLLTEHTTFKSTALNKYIKTLKKEQYVKQKNTVKFPKEEILEVLRSPNLMQNIVNVTHEYGHVGEDDLKKAIILASINKMSPDPIHIIVKGDSSTGKSSTVESVLDLLEGESILSLTSMSKQALNYMGELGGGIQNKILYLGEAGGVADEELQTALRQLMSEGRIVRYVTVTDPDTDKRYVEAKVTEGPATVFITTTSYQVDDETETRMMSLTTDASPAQSRKIQEIQNRIAARPGKEKDPRNRLLYRQALESLKFYPVVIPFASYLGFPIGQPRTRRDNGRMLSLIKASALLHQHQREFFTSGKDNRYLRANLEDYALVHSLLRMIPSCVNGIDTRALDHHAELLERFGDRPLNLNHVRQKKGWKKAKAYETMTALQIAGLASIIAGNKPDNYTYQLKDKKIYPKLNKYIKTPDEVIAIIREKLQDDEESARILGIEDFEKTYTLVEEITPVDQLNALLEVSTDTENEDSSAPVQPAAENVVEEAF